MNNLRRIPAREFQIKDEEEKKTFHQKASDIRDAAFALGYSGPRRISRNNFNLWIAFIRQADKQQKRAKRERKSEIARLQNRNIVRRAIETRESVFKFNQNSRIEDRRASYTEISYTLSVIKTISSLIDLNNLAESIIEQLNGFIARVIRENNLSPNDKLTFSMVSENGEGLTTGFVSRDDMSGDLLADKIRMLISNYAGFQLDDTTQVYIKIVRYISPENAVVGAKKMVCTSKEDIYNRKSIIRVDGGNDETCFMQCIALGFAHMRQRAEQDGLTKGRIVDQFETDWVKMTKSKTKQKYREKSASLISNFCTVSASKTELKHDVLSKIQGKLDIEIVIFDLNTGLRRLWPEDDVILRQYRPAMKIYMLKNENHVDFIKEPQALFGKEKWCPVCFTGYDKTHLKCNQTCERCLSSICAAEQKDKAKALKEKLYIFPPGVSEIISSFLPKYEIECKDCHQGFFSEDCYDRHLQGIACVTRTYCNKCFSMYDRSKNEHVCGKKRCPNCMQNVDLTSHKCFIKKLEVPTKVENNKYIYYDCESFVNTNPHKAFLFIAMYNTPTQVCVGEDEVFQFKSEEEFCKWVLSKKHKGYTAIAHNAGGYDIQFIRNYCTKNGILPTKSSEIFKGGKLISCKYNGVRFIDSIRFINGSLSSFADTFGLDKSQFSKGYFPYRFVTPENLHTTFPSLPEKHWFEFEKLKNKKSLAEAEQWYEENKNKPFNPWKEAVLYCRQDVSILKQGCEIFKNMFIQTSKIDPFEHITIASVCQKIYLQNDMPVKSIAVIPNKSRQTMFKGQEEFLNYKSHELGRELKRQVRIFAPAASSANSKKEVICDGYDTETKTAYEFYGCYFHGCPMCYKTSFFNKKLQSTMGSLLAKVKEKESRLKRWGYNVVSIWECEWNKEKKSLPKHLWEYEDDMIDFRDAIKGGRTEVFQTQAQSDDEMEINYYDYVSLYPSIMRGRLPAISSEEPCSSGTDGFARYPIGHPEYIKRPSVADATKALLIDKYYGFIKCQILPPQDLKIPVLGNTFDNKFKFALCATCASSLTSLSAKGLAQDGCQHSENERALTGTWTSIEVKKALMLGYRFLTVYCIAHFPQTYSTWDDVNDVYIFSDLSINLFSSYINRFFSIKDKAAKEGNAGLKAIAKLCLNNLWGKFAQREIMTRRETCSGKRCHELVHNSPDVVVSDITYLSPDVYSVEFKDKLECMEDKFKLSAVIGAYTTSLARLRLYEALEILGDDVIYCDTDSVVFKSKKGSAPKVLSSNEIGALEDELKGKHIKEIVCLAPKTYGYITDEGKVEVKCKGFILNLKNQESVNIDSYRAMVNGSQKTIETRDMQFKIHKHSGLIETTELKKEMTYNPDKRIILTGKLAGEKGTLTVPYGFVAQSSRNEQSC